MNCQVAIPADLNVLTAKQTLQDFNPSGHERYLSALSKIIHAIQGLIGEIELDGRNYTAEFSLATEFQRNWEEVRTARKKEISHFRERLAALEEIYKTRREALVTKTAERTLEKAILELSSQPVSGRLWGSTPSIMEVSLNEIRELLGAFVEKKDEADQAQQTDISEFRDKFTQLASRTAAYLEQLTVITSALKNEDAAARRTKMPSIFFHHYQASLEDDSQIKKELEATIEDYKDLKNMWDAYVENEMKIKKMLESMQQAYSIPVDSSQPRKIKSQISPDNLLSSIQALRQQVLFHKELGSNAAELNQKLEDLAKRVAEHQSKVQERTVLIKKGVAAYAVWETVLTESLESANRKFARLEKAAKGMDSWAIEPAK